MKQSIILKAGRHNADHAIGFIANLPQDKAWTVEISPYAPKRSENQNNYLWGVCYRAVLDSGLREAGWTAEDVHEYFLGEHFGWHTIEGLDRKRIKPTRRSSTLNKQEFTDFIAFIQRTMAEKGVYIPEANEYETPD